jgi:hypothetical protein
MRTLTLALSLASIVALAACDDTTSANAADGAPAQDAGTPDATAKPDQLQGPWANVYEQNPLVDKKTTSRVLLKNITDSKGHLTGKYAEVWNCLPEDGGKPFNMGPMSGKLCNVRQQALPGKDGTYLQIKPPQNEVAGNDAFAEVMMYHHIDAIHRHYSESFGLKHLDAKGLYAIVNIQGFLDTTKQWMGLPNAAFVAKGSGGFLSAFGLNLDKDAIIFGFNNGGMMGAGLPKVNFTYDAAVIYHEYTHYTIGEALHATAAPDKYGLSPTPMALNEGLADYFPSSFLENPRLGNYALGSQSRDLTEPLRCPEDIRGESHHDGRIAAGALWSARKLLGADVLDQAVWNAVLTFNIDTSYDEAAAAILDEVKQVAPDKLAAVEKIFEDRGFSGCKRVVEHKDFVASPLDPLSGVRYSGSYGISTSYPDGVPTYMQYTLAITDGTKEVTILYRPAQQSFYGGSGGRGNVWVALKAGDTPITYDYTGGAGKSDADTVLKGADEGQNDLKLVLSGDCLKGKLTFQFVNRDASSGVLNMVKVTQSATKTNTVDNFSGCDS